MRRNSSLLNDFLTKLISVFHLLAQSRTNNLQGSFGLIKFHFLQPIAYICSRNPTDEHCSRIFGELFLWYPLNIQERTFSETVRDSITFSNGTRFDQVVDLARSFFILHHLFLVVVVGDSFW